MPAPVFIGDEVSAAGYRLAGAVVRTPEPGEEAATLEAARSEAQLVLITAEYAERIARPQLNAALGAETPLVLVVAGVRDRNPPPDPGARLRILLGLES